MTTPTPSLTSEERIQAEGLLQQAPVAFVAMVEGPRPYVVPMNYAYEPARGNAPARLYLHSGPGRKSRALAANPRVCVAVTADAAFDQGSSPCEDGFSFRSVIVEGQTTLLEALGDRQSALRAIVAKYDPGAAEVLFNEAALAKTLIYAVAVDSLTYKERPRD